MNNLSDELNAKWFYNQVTALSKDIFIRTGDYQKLEDLPRMDNHDEKNFIFTHGGGSHERSIDQTIITAIDNAIENKEFLLLSSFIINNTEILEKLKEACHHLPGKVYILVGRPEPISVSYDFTGQISYGGLAELAIHGGLIRRKENAHLKFLVSGSGLAIIMTTNITTEGLRRNPEFGLVIKDQIIIHALKRLFMVLWMEKAENTLIQKKWTPAPNWKPVKRKISKEAPSSFKLILSSNVLRKEINKNEQILCKDKLSKIVEDLIESADNVIKISTYSINLDEKSHLLKLLIEKAEKNVEIQILVPLVKVQQNNNMKSILMRLKSHPNIDVRYYRELHGKLIHVDNEKVLLLTANLDRFLFSDETYDIGIEIQEPATIRNMETIFDHLWNEASTGFEMYAPINLDVNLVVYSEDSISPRHRNVSVLTLAKIVKDNDKMEWLLHENESILRIYQANGRKFDVPMEHNSIDDYDEYTTVTAKITPSSTFKKKEATFFTVNELRLRVLWEGYYN